MIRDGRWSRSHDQCVHCGRTDRPHEAKGFCKICYSYNRDRDKARAKRKRHRVRNDVIAKRYPKVRQWHVDHADEVKEYKKKWHQEKGPVPKWPVGKTVWCHCGARGWCHGTIIDRPNNSTIWVQMKGFKVKTCGAKLRDHDPELRSMLEQFGE